VNLLEAIHTPHNNIKHKHNETRYTTTNAIVPWWGTMALSCEGSSEGKGGEEELQERLKEEVKHFVESARKLMKQFVVRV
jgi:hypothetical protein